MKKQCNLFGRKWNISLLIGMLIFGVGSFAQANATHDLHATPKNLSSLNETYQDWRVVCQSSGTRPRCEAAQQIFSNQTHQHVLSVELMPVSGHYSGVVLTPLGVALARGVALQADNQVITGPLAFTACVSNGCMAPLTLTSSQINAMQNAHIVAFRAVTLGGQNIVLPISNHGLGEAIKRLTILKIQ